MGVDGQQTLESRPLTKVELKTGMAEVVKVALSPDHPVLLLYGCIASKGHQSTHRAQGHRGGQNHRGRQGNAGAAEDAHSFVGTLNAYED